MKSFQEIFNQVLAEMQAGRQKAATFQKSPAAERPPYVLKTPLRAPSGKNPKGSPSVSPKEKSQQMVKPRVLTEIQKEALECFRRHGEMLDETAGEAEIKKAFRRLAKRLHPDKASGLGPETQKIWAQEFQQIHLAYRHLLEIHSLYK